MPNFLFDRRRVRLHRDRAAARLNDYDFLFREASARLADRLEDITRRFPLALELGARGLLAPFVKPHIGTLIQAELSFAQLRRASGLRVACDEEWLPFAPNSLDAALSALSLQWVNDLPGALIQIRHALKPDGLFLAVLPGANTLIELRQSILDAATQHDLPAAPMLSPQAEVRDAGALLQRAGFALPVADTETITVSYEHPFKLFADLRGMGEQNALMAQHKGFTPRRLFTAIAECYQSRFADHEGRIPATFELVFLTGWKPHASQQQPAKRGSGQVSLKDVLHQPFL
jgi:SAM-dependent methyltransferase